MKYERIVRGVFLERPNRFIARVEIAGQVETVHVKNTGRCRELLLPGVTVYLEASANPLRKTGYDLIAVEKVRPGKAPLLVNMDSQIPNAVAAEWIAVSGIFGREATIRREVTFGKSRFDLYIESGERRCFVEVKGVTLENDGVASFPDAPTERGVKHLRELVECIGSGYEAAILFVIQMKGIRSFRPAEKLHPEFADALRQAADAGVRVLAMDCLVTPDSIVIDQPVPVMLHGKD